MSETEQEPEALAKLKVLDPAKVFVLGGMDEILEYVREQTTGELADLTTAKGRDRVKSLAYEVTKAKTQIEELGKELADEINKKLKPINVERKKAKE